MTKSELIKTVYLLLLISVGYFSTCLSLLVAPLVGMALPITPIQSLSQIPRDQPTKTLFLFDLDDTIFDSVSMLGSKGWRRYMREITQRMGSGENWHDLFSYLLAQSYPIETVEEITVGFIRDLQRRGFPACGLTARERHAWYDTPQEGIDRLTIDQLTSVGVRFHTGDLEKVYPYLVQDSEYFEGVLFSNTELKGTYLLRLFGRAQSLPEKVIFIDDKLNQVESVEVALTQLGIPHACYLYLATDQKLERFSPLIANAQLYYFCKSQGQWILTDAEAAAMTQEQPECSADDYLNAVLMNVKGSAGRSSGSRI